MAVLGFIGMGNMGHALMKGVKSKFENEIVFHDYSEKVMEEISQKDNVEYTKTNGDVLKEAKYIVLAIKPQVYPSVLAEIKEYVTKEHVFISLAPGVTLAQVGEQLGTNRIIRTMPNTPAMVSEGMTGLSFEENNFTEEEIDVVKTIFESIGQYSIVSEKLMDAVVCASGSSPAYVFMFIEALADSVVKCGMPRNQAYQFVAQTVLGSAKLMLETGKHPGELKDMVCSPGGTTIAGVAELEKNGFRKSIFEATDACFEKCNSIK